MKSQNRKAARIPLYAPPLDQLLTLGNPAGGDGMWREAPLEDYAAMGLSVEHTDELARMAADPCFDQLSAPQLYAPIHAFRALAALGCVGALPAMIRVVERMDRMGDDGWLEDAPGVLAAFGPTAIKPLAAAWRDQRTAFGARLFIGDAMERIALRWPEHRGTVVGVFTETLKVARYTDPGINGRAICSLVELNAVESLPEIRAAFGGDLVDEVCADTLETVERQIHMSAEERRADDAAMWAARDAAAKRPFSRMAETLGAKYGDQ